MTSYKLIEARALGDFDPKFGQKWWCKAEGIDIAVTFNTQRTTIDADIIHDGSIMVYAEEQQTRTSAKGTGYIQLKKVKFDNNPNTTSDSPIPFTNNPADHSAVKENKYQRDVTSIPLDVWRTLVGIQGVPTNQTEFHKFFTTVQEHANELLRMIDNVRSGTHLDSPTQTPESFQAHPPAAAVSLGDQYRNRNVEPELTDEDMPEDL